MTILVGGARRMLGRIALLGLAACTGSDGLGGSSTTVVPAEVKWVEWPAEISSPIGESLRVVVYAPCGALRLSLASDTLALTIRAEEEVNDDGSCIGVGTGVYDTLLPLPQLQPAEPPDLTRPATFVIRAPVHNYVTRVLEPAVLGEIRLTIRPPFVDRRAVAGRVRLTVDPAGCTWSTIDIGAFAAEAIVDPPLLDMSRSSSLTALLKGFYDSTEPVPCGQARGVRVSILQVDLPGTISGIVDEIPTAQ